MEEFFFSNNNDSRLLSSPSSPTGQTELTSGPVDFTPSLAEFTPSPSEVSMAVLLGVFCALGVPGNVAVLVLLRRRGERKNFTQRLMLNLACCDLLYLATLPVWMLHALARPRVTLALCRALSFLVFWSLYVNIFTITLMSVQRFFKVLHHHRWSRVGPGGERALLLALWGGSCLLTGPSVASAGRQKDGHFDCSRASRMDGRTLAATVLELLLGFLVPFSVMTSAYCCLWRRLEGTHRRTTTTAPPRSDDVTGRTPALSRSDDVTGRTTTSSRSDDVTGRTPSLSGTNRRTSQLISRIIVTFLVLWVPIHLVGLVGLVGRALSSSHPDLSSSLEVFTDRAKVVKNLPLLSAIIDPFLYAWSYRRLWTSRH